MKTIAQAVKDKRRLASSEAPTVKVLINGTDRTAQLVQGGVGSIDMKFEKRLGIAKPADVHVKFDDVSTIKAGLALDWTDKLEIQLGFGTDLVTYFKGYIDPVAIQEDDLGIELASTAFHKKLERSSIASYLGVEKLTSTRRLIEKLVTNLQAAPPPNGITWSHNIDRLEYDVQSAKRLSFIELVDGTVGPADAADRGSGVNYRSGAAWGGGGYTSCALVTGSGTYEYYYVFILGDKVKGYGLDVRTKDVVATLLWTITAQLAADRMKVIYATGGASGYAVLGSGTNFNDRAHDPKHFWRVNITNGTVIEQTDYTMGPSTYRETLESSGYFPDLNRIVLGGNKPTGTGDDVVVYLVNPATGLRTNTFNPGAIASAFDGEAALTGATSELFGTKYWHFFRTREAIYAVPSTITVATDIIVNQDSAIKEVPALNGSVFQGTQRVYFSGHSTRIVDHTGVTHAPTLPAGVSNLNGAQYGQGDQSYIVQTIQSGADIGKLRFLKLLANDITPFTPTVTEWDKNQFPDELRKVAPEERVGDFKGDGVTGPPARVISTSNLLIPISLDLTQEPFPISNMKGTTIAHVGDVVIPYIVLNDFTLDNNDSVRDTIEDIAIASSAFWIPAQNFGEIKLVRRRFTGAAVATFSESDYILDSYRFERWETLIDFVEINGQIIGTQVFGADSLRIVVHWLPAQLPPDLGQVYYNLYATARDKYSIDGNFLIEVDPGDIVAFTIGATTRTGFVYKVRQEEIETHLELVQVYT